MTRRSGVPDSVSYTVPVTTAVSGGAGATGCCASSRAQGADSKEQTRSQARGGSTLRLPRSWLAAPYGVQDSETQLAEAAGSCDCRGSARTAEAAGLRQFTDTCRVAGLPADEQRSDPVCY